LNDRLVVAVTIVADTDRDVLDGLVSKAVRDRRCRADDTCAAANNGADPIAAEETIVCAVAADLVVQALAIHADAGIPDEFDRNIAIANPSGNARASEVVAWVWLDAFAANTD
jgi:hypothetical protein